MSDRAEYDAFVERSPQGSLFCSSWWLDAVAPGRWRSHEVREDDEIVAAWPTVARSGRFGPEHGGAPITPWLGPLFREDDNEYRRRSMEDEMTGRLLESIGPYAHLEARCSPHYDYWTPLHWRGFTQTTRYTWRIEELGDLEAAFSRLRNKIRGHIGRARRGGVVIEAGDLAGLLAVHGDTVERQGLAVEQTGRRTLAQVDPPAAARGARTILLARDTEGRVHGGGYFVHDARTTYYLMGGSNTGLRSSGAMPLLLWTAIEQAAERGTAFDFEGSMLRHVELFVRAFGGRPRPYSVVRHTPSLPLRGLTAVKRSALGLRR
jgi:hypothetical protein